MLYEAIVTEVLPKVAGVRVRFRDLVPSGFGINDYVRVLCPSMSTHGGAALWLPEEGEHGVVGELRGGTCIWLGSTPFLDQNQVDPTPGIAYQRHRSGVTTQIRDNGDFEIAHPSGLRITASVSGGALPELQHSSKPIPRGGEVPVLGIVHPSGTSLKIDADGNLAATVVGGLNVHVSGAATIQADGDVTLGSGAATVAITASGVTVTAPMIGLEGSVLVNGEPIPTVAEIVTELAGTIVPSVDGGTGSVGTHTRYAREDHVHPVPGTTGGGGGGGDTGSH